MAFYYLKNQKEKIQISDKPFAGGGEGDLYEVISSGYKKMVAKIYHPQKQTAERESKITYLLENPPADIESSNAVVWVIDAIYDSKNQFVGFIMPFVKGEKLEVLCTPKLPKRLRKNTRWTRLSLNTANALHYRLRVCFNLAAAIYQVHQTDHYVLVDMKPDNIIIQPNGLVSIVDMDSVEVIDNGIAIFPAPVATPEYTPPEFYTPMYRADSTVGESWDRFGLAVIFYKLLFGIHPFAATANPPFDNLVSLHEKIKEGLFVHHPDANQLLNIIPPPHYNLELLPFGLQELFLRCFIEGHENPHLRPTADEWCLELLEAIGDEKLKKHFGHLFIPRNNSLAKVAMPNSLLRKHQADLDIKNWLQQKVNELTSPLHIPARIARVAQVGSKEENLSLEIKDYLFSGGLFVLISLIVGIFFPSFLKWLAIDFWLQSYFFINLVFFVALLFFIIVAPRISSLWSHFNSTQTKIRKHWNILSKKMPVLHQHKRSLKKEIEHLLHSTNLLNQLPDTQNKQKEVKTYLFNQQKQSNQIQHDYRTQVATIDQKYLQEANKNKWLQKLGARSLNDLKNRLVRKTDALQQIFINQLQEDYKKSEAGISLWQNYTNDKSVLFQQRKKAYDKFDKKVTYLNSIDNFVKDFAKNNSLLRKHFKSNNFELNDMTQVVRTPSTLDIYTSTGKFRVTSTIHNDLDSLHAALKGLLPVAKFLQSTSNYLSKSTTHPVYIDFEQKLVKLKNQYNEKEKEAVLELFKTHKPTFESELETATKYLEELYQKYLDEINLLEAQTLQKLKKIYQESEEKVQGSIEQLNQVYHPHKIAIQDILKRPEIQVKKQLIESDEKEIKDKVEQIKSILPEDKV